MGITPPRLLRPSPKPRNCGRLGRTFLRPPMGVGQIAAHVSRLYRIFRSGTSGGAMNSGPIWELPHRDRLAMCDSGPEAVHRGFPGRDVDIASDEKGRSE